MPVSEERQQPGFERKEKVVPSEIPGDRTSFPNFFHDEGSLRGLRELSRHERRRNEVEPRGVQRSELAETKKQR